MIFAILGFFVLKRSCRKLFFPILLVSIITYYVNSSWWCWWWGGSFGNRGMIEFYAILAFPMAALYEKMLKPMRKWMLVSFISLFIFYNLYQSYRFKATVIHWDSTSKESFWWGFFKIKISKSEYEEMKKMLIPPDESKSKR